MELYSNKIYIKGALKALCKEKRHKGYGLTDLAADMTTTGIETSEIQLRKKDGGAANNGKVKKDYSGTYSLPEMLAICDILSMTPDEFVNALFKSAKKE